MGTYGCSIWRPPKQANLSITHLIRRIRPTANAWPWMRPGPPPGVFGWLIAKATIRSRSQLIPARKLPTSHPPGLLTARRSSSRIWCESALVSHKGVLRNRGTHEVAIQGRKVQLLRLEIHTNYASTNPKLRAILQHGRAHAFLLEESAVGGIQVL